MMEHTSGADRREKHFSPTRLHARSAKEDAKVRAYLDLGVLDGGFGDCHGRKFSLLVEVLQSKRWAVWI